ncbi:MAG: CPBP family intramembrane metalloprotease [Treponema sp.]|nr:CPBP family intramembrane metalloprotease [Treponema sp.]
MENKIPIRFFIVTFLWSWGILVPIALLINFRIIEIDVSNLLIALPISLMGALGPAAGAFFSLYTINGKGAVKEYCKKFISIKFGWKAWISMFFILGGAYFTAWIIPEFFGENRIPSFIPIYIFPVYLLLMIFMGGGQEEIGWRGYILPFLEKKYGLIMGSLILGIIWSIWHIPLWFIPGTTQVYMNFIAFTFMTIGYSYIFSWIIELSSNRLLSGLVAHGIANGFAVIFPTLVMDKNANQIRFWIYTVIILILGIIIVSIRTYRSRKTSA